MGFFSNLKNAVTGGAATVSVQVPAGQRGSSVPFQIQAIAKSNGNVQSVYLLVRALESAQVSDTDYNGGQARKETVHGQRVTYETRIAVAGAMQLQEGQTYRWEGQLPLPTNANPSFAGQMVNHTWQIQAGLEMTGNDPDSGWQTVQVS